MAAMSTTMAALVGASASSAFGAVIREGWVLKKRRKKMQGFARRYFTLYQSGILVYAFDRDQPIRDQVSLHHSAVSTAPGRKDIHIDSTTTFHIKCLSTEDFEAWMTAFRKFIPTAEARKSASVRHITRQGSISVNKSGAILEEMASTLAELEEAIHSLPPEDAKKSHRSKQEKERLRHEKEKYEKVDKHDKHDKHAVFGLFKRSSQNSSMHDGDPGTASEPLERSPVQHICDVLESLKAQHAMLLKSIHTLALLDVNAQSLRASPILPATAEEDEAHPIWTHSPATSLFTPHPGKRMSSMTTTTTDSGVEWFDAESDGAEEFVLDVPPAIESQQPSKIVNASTDSLGHSSIDTDIADEPEQSPVEINRRAQLPARPIGDEGSLFAVLKKNVGKDLSTIAFPVTFNEPLSLLQRAAEEVEYYDLLNLAAASQDSVERLCYVAAFAVSGYAHTRYRTGRKGFNPMLGETFEDPRMKFIAEKVRHHPLEMAYHAQGDHWELTSTSAGKTKFWGKSLEVIPLGSTIVVIGEDRYEWKKPSSFMRNIMVGTKYLEHVGKMVIENTNSGERCAVEFKPSGYFGASNLVSATVYAASGKTVTHLEGKWDDQISQQLDDSHFRILWRVTPYPKDTQEYYGFTTFGISLNEVTRDLEGRLPPTDSRLRPDIRALEEGNLDLAESEKSRVEEAQRDRRRAGRDTQPRWFRQVGEEWEYVGGYWEARAQGWKDTGLQPLW
ncbi:unnamed protein product [Mycena citricolor]|uniref:PH domain-containing protein n=1 Tax=Mycena citricolor TaxID=2018698 RepID=A0AAD2HQ90_9AGAR|nr:unnamed protein product [Mycena citricolor]CAK5280123.1 unnamed protein product [Mycena citricolor]